MSNELIVAENLKPEEIFSNGGIDSILDEIKTKVTGFVPNLETAAGRKEIASLAHKVARSKTLLDDLGKNLVSGWKKKAKAVDSERKRMRDSLDELKEEVRRPLTEWEDAEKERIASIEGIVKETVEAGERTVANWLQLPLEAMEDRLQEIKAIVVDESFAEYSPVMAQTKDKAISQIEQAIEQRKKHDAEQAELAKLRKEAEERKQKEHEEQIRKEAEERAKREAEEKAAREKEEYERRIREQKEAAERAERDRIASEERAKIEREQAVKEAERRAKEESEKKEHERLEKERVEREAAERKAANKKHREKIKREAVKFIRGIYGTTNEQAEGIFDAISNGAVPHITINY